MPVLPFFCELTSTKFEPFTRRSSVLYYLAEVQKDKC
jgi:hypothetical protein